jgi:hypothetical protein
VPRAVAHRWAYKKSFVMTFGAVWGAGGTGGFGICVFIGGVGGFGTAGIGGTIGFGAAGVIDAIGAEVISLIVRAPDVAAGTFASDGLNSV